MGAEDIFGNAIMPVPDPDVETFRISLFGAPLVGKSSLICQVCVAFVDLEILIHVLKQSSTVSIWCF